MYVCRSSWHVFSLTLSGVLDWDTGRHLAHIIAQMGKDERAHAVEEARAYGKKG